MKSVIPREVETLWTLFTAPVVWALHFITCYATVAVFCAKRLPASFSFDTVRIVLVVVTIAALAVIVLSAYLAWRQWGFGEKDAPHDKPTRSSRTLFQGFATLLLSGLSFVSVVYAAIPLIFIVECQP
jgi:Kef-type K+ transport system membrane component KefB